MTAEVYRPDVLSFRLSQKALQKPLLTPFPYQGHSNVPKLSRHSGKNKKKVLLAAVVPSFWKEGSGVVEKKTVITYLCYIGQALFVSLPPRPSDTPPPRRMGQHMQQVFFLFFSNKSGLIVYSYLKKRVLYPRHGQRHS